MPRFTLPRGVATWRVRDARLPACFLADPTGPADADGLVAVDFVVTGDTIAEIGPAGAASAHGDLPALVSPGLLMPAFVDAHTHLDKGHIWPRAPNPDGTFLAALDAVPRDRIAHWTTADVRARMDFALRCAYAHGTRAMRTHLDCGGTQTRISYPVFAALRDAWRDRIDLQASPLFPIDLALDDAHMGDVTEMVTEHGHCLGAVTFPGRALQPGLDRLFRLAADKGWDLDFHVDETNDPSVNTLAVVARTAIDHKFNGRILVGHCCTLSLLGKEDRKRTIDLVARAGLSVVSLALCNLYLQDRTIPPTTPRWRGITALHELRAAGVPVALASDNTRDPFYAYGDLDMVEVWREGTRIAHLDHPFADWPKAVTTTPAEALGLEGGASLTAGARADFVVFQARSLSEFLSRPQTPRTVVRQGRPIEATVPDYRDLDGLEGFRP